MKKPMFLKKAIKKLVVEIPSVEQKCLPAAQEKGAVPDIGQNAVIEDETAKSCLMSRSDPDDPCDPDDPL